MRLSLLSNLDYRSTLRLCILTLWPALGLYLLTQQTGWFALVALPLLTAVYCKLCLELALPQLGRYRENLRVGKYPQAFFHAVLALQRLEKRPSLNYLNVLRPALAHPNLKEHLESELAAIKLLQGEIPEAERRLRKLVDSGRAEPIVYHNLAVVLAEGGQWEQARHFVRVARGLGVCPPYRVTRRRAFWARLSPSQTDQHLQWIWDVGGFYRKLGLHHLALACCDQTRHQALSLARVHSLLALGKQESAEAEALKAVRRDPRNARNQMALCLVRQGQEKWGEALELARKASRLDQEWALARRICYGLEIWQSDSDQLRELLIRVCEHEPHRALKLSTQAAIYCRLEQWQACLDVARQAVGTPGESTVLGGVVGIALAEIGNRKEAVGYLRDFLAYTELNPYPLAHLERRRARARLVLDNNLCDV